MMPDREKVISGLQRCRLMNKVNCDKCPYDYNGRGNGKSECTAELADDALELLKKHEPVSPTWQQGKAYCGSCGKRIPLKIGARFCHKCGKRIKWEGR